MCKFCTNPYGEKEDEKNEEKNLDADYYLTCPDCGLIPFLKFDYNNNFDPLLIYDCLCLNSETNKISYIYHQLRNNLQDSENENKNIYECNCYENNSDYSDNNSIDSNNKYNDCTFDFIGFCFDCEKNFCEKCKKIHLNHNYKFFDNDCYLNLNENKYKNISNKINEIFNFSEKYLNLIDKFILCLENKKKIFEKFKNNFNQICNVLENVFEMSKFYDSKNKINFQLIENLKIFDKIEINNFEYDFEKELKKFENKINKENENNNFLEKFLRNKIIVNNNKKEILKEKIIFNNNNKICNIKNYIKINEFVNENKIMRLKILNDGHFLVEYYFNLIKIFNSNTFKLNNEIFNSNIINFENFNNKIFVKNVLNKNIYFYEKIDELNFWGKIKYKIKNEKINKIYELNNNNFISLEENLIKIWNVNNNNNKLFVKDEIKKNCSDIKIINNNLILLIENKIDKIILFNIINKKTDIINLNSNYNKIIVDNKKIFLIDNKNLILFDIDFKSVLLRFSFENNIYNLLFFNNKNNNDFIIIDNNFNKYNINHCEIKEKKLNIKSKLEINDCNLNNFIIGKNNHIHFNKNLNIITYGN